MTGERGTILPLARLIHDETCGDAERCARWESSRAHRDYYRDRAVVIMAALEPEIGLANVIIAVRVILGEMA